MAEATMTVTVMHKRPTRTIDYYILGVLLWILADVSNAAPIHADIAELSHNVWTALGAAVIVWGLIETWRR